MPDWIMIRLKKSIHLKVIQSVCLLTADKKPRKYFARTHFEKTALQDSMAFEVWPHFAASALHR